MAEKPPAVEFNPPKSEWGDGPWQHEPDRIDFVHAGLDCLALRNHWGVWCGYVAVKPGHPFYGKNYDEGPDVEVHGGLTYADFCCHSVCHVPRPGEPDNVWWFGFDCSHAWDFNPGINARLRQIGGPPRDPDSPFHPREEYRDLAYVMAEIRRLAEQLAALRADRDDTSAHTSQPQHAR